MPAVTAPDAPAPIWRHPEFARGAREMAERLAMLGAVAGLASGEGVEVAGMESAAVSYPGFEQDLRALVRG